MHRFEGFTEAKDPLRPETCEDRLVIVPRRLYAVIDGATDISGRRYDDRYGRQATGGYLAAQAVAEALTAMAAAALPALPDPGEVAARLDAAIAALHDRLGIAVAASSGEERFRAGFTAAFLAGDRLRLVALGDCLARVNGEPVLAHAFPGDLVLSFARSAAWRRLAARGLAPAAIRPAARALIVQGLAEGPAPPAGLTAAEVREIRAEVRGDPRAVALCGTPGAVDRFLAAGLAGIRRDPAGFDAHALDGSGGSVGQVRALDLDLAGVRTLELASDGYPVPGDTATIAAWEAALARADADDPDRIGAHPGTKGRTPALFGDDRSLLILTWLR